MSGHWRVEQPTAGSPFFGDYSVSIDGDDCLKMLKQLQRFPFVVFVSLGWPLALKQNASFLTEGIAHNI